MHSETKKKKEKNEQNSQKPTNIRNYWRKHTHTVLFLSFNYVTVCDVKADEQNKIYENC